MGKKEIKPPFKQNVRLPFDEFKQNLETYIELMFNDVGGLSNNNEVDKDYGKKS